MVEKRIKCSKVLVTLVVMMLGLCASRVQLKCVSRGRMVLRRLTAWGKKMLQSSSCNPDALITFARWSTVGVIHSAGGFVEAACTVTIICGRKRNNILGCFQYLL